ncbi:MAG: bifunctional heptose 7-phosphate kinase/heptose 1-phosphate adenyltransferase [Akkermansia sp.]|nr:bifunctional heptose 7-phosphate kinase/heptose 1-phosphate adenyltransferase [Akkermansia sp.]
MANLYSYVDVFPSMRVMCVGDMMLDIFVYGKTNRLSPEAPVPVLLEQRQRCMLGGAGNVVANLCSLGCQTSFVGVVGQDADGAALRNYMTELGAECDTLLELPGYSTSVKTRYVSGRQHLLRVDREVPLQLPDDALAGMLAKIEARLKETDMVLLSDYGKGLFDERFTPAVIELSRKAGCKVIVDPKTTDYTIYRGATLVKPNRKEFEGVTGQSFDPAAPGFADAAVAAGRAVCKRYGVENLLVTLSEYGMLYIPGREDESYKWIPTEAKEVFDVSGAGDTSLAVLGAALATGVSMKQAMKIANAASGIVVGKFGTACVTCDELKRKLEHKEQAGVLTVAAATQLANELREQGMIIGFTNGCFDILHPGHLSSFERARDLCDVLFVGLNSDASVRRLKGPTRPVNNEMARSAMVAALKPVSYVVIFEDDTALPLIEKLRPDVIAKEGYPIEKWPEGQLVESYGGKAVELPRVDGFSTTSIVEKINS